MVFSLALHYNRDIIYQSYWNSLETLHYTHTVYMYMSPSSGWSQFMTFLLEGSTWSDTDVCFDTANLLFPPPESLFSREQRCEQGKWRPFAVALLAVAPAASSSRSCLQIHIHDPQHLSLLIFHVCNRKPCWKVAESWGEGISGPRTSYRHVTMGPTNTEIWRHGKRAVCVCYLSNGNLEQRNSSRETVVNALWSKPDTSMYNNV